MKYMYIGNRKIFCGANVGFTPEKKPVKEPEPEPEPIEEDNANLTGKIITVTDKNGKTKKKYKRKYLNYKL